MNATPIRVLSLPGDPVSLGSAHGRTFAREIEEFAKDRFLRSRMEADLSDGQLRDLAAVCLPFHRDYAPDLYEEMTAMADEAGITAAEAMIVGGFTDFIDAVRAHAGGAAVSDNCTAVLVPDHAAGGAGFLAQTWDMHASAAPHVVMLRLEPDTGPAALIYSTVGCLGQIGMNEAGIAVGINNLTSDDGGVGVTWPFVVRKVLQQTNLEAAVDCVMNVPLAGGHNYLLFDRRGRGFNVEAMPTARRVTELGAEPLVHTNHCLFPETQAVEAFRPPELAFSSATRLEDAARLLRERPVTEKTLMALTRDEDSICRHPTPTDTYQTCGAVIMRPRNGQMWACWGVPSESEYQRFELEGASA